jgi:hypothetical protein
MFARCAEVSLPATDAAAPPGFATDVRERDADVELAG